MLTPDLKKFTKIAQKGSVIPVYREIIADLETPVSTFMKLASKQKYAYLLESVEGGERWGRYSFISWAPKLIFRSTGGSFCAAGPGQKQVWKKTSDPMQELKNIMAGFKPVEIEGLPRFWGGAVGFVSYDMVRFFENLPDKPEDTLEFPDSLFMITDRLVIFDHLNHTLKIVICIHTGDTRDKKRAYHKAEKEIERVIALLKRPLKLRKSRVSTPRKLGSNMTPSEFCRKVEKTKEYIRAGDVIQTVISQRFSRETAAPAFDIYRNLRLINPSPYMYYLQLDDFEIVGTSPEILVRKEDSSAETRPIAGTIRRGKNAREEAGLEKELLSDEKERAEHVMLVDLGRNDLARVCEPASVTVPQFMIIEKYSHVMHIVSSVTGKLKPGLDSFALFRACFPAGTVSGAPKVRAMQIIDELEPTARGPYAGAIGYFSYSGNMDMAITIRTIVMKNKTAYVQAGAGLVADSVPKREYQESKNKAQALFSAIDRAEKGTL